MISGCRTRVLMPDVRTLLSAAMIVLSAAPFDLHWLTWLAFIPWFYALVQAGSKRAAVIQGIWLCFFMSLGTFYWVAYVLQRFGHLPWSVAIACLLLFCFFAQPQFYILSLAFRRFLALDGNARDERRRVLFAITSLSLLYAGVDWVLPKLFADTVGHSLHSTRRLSQVADLGGVPLLTFLIVFTNVAIWRTIYFLGQRSEPSIWPSLRRTLPLLGGALGLVALAWGYGSFREGQIRSLQESPLTRARIALIQGNIGDFDKLAAEEGVRDAARGVIRSLTEMTDRALTHSPKPEAIVWPETSYPSTFRTPSSPEEEFRDRWIESFVKERGVPLLFGGYDHHAGKDHNALFFLYPSGEHSVYRKHILLIFGEYIPGAESIAAIRRAFPQVGNFGRGAGPESIPVSLGTAQAPKTIRMAPVICYESLFPSYAIQAARKGAQLILNITNDSWYGDSSEPWLHLSVAKFRSIETRLPQVRSTNTGVSALVLPDGQVLQKSSLFQPEIIHLDVPIIEPVPTLMKAWGDWFAWFAFFVGLGGVLGALNSGLSKVHRHPSKT